MKELHVCKVFGVSTLLLIGIYSCEFKEPASIGPHQNGSLKKSSSLLTVNYDERQSSFSINAPTGIGNPDRDSLTMLDYQRQAVELSFDKNGYFHMEQNHLEGNEDIRMPINVWQETKNIRPAVDPTTNPVIKVIFSDGIMQRIGEKGVVSAVPYDAEQFRIDPKYVDSLFVEDCDSCVEERKNRMSDNGIIFTMLGDYYAKIDTYYDNSFIGKISEVMDLRNGLTSKIAYYQKDGRFDTFAYLYHQIVNGLPVECNEVVYSFGFVKGNWQAKLVTFTDRSNITVTRNGYGVDS